MLGVKEMELRLENICKSIDDKIILENINLNFRSGMIYGLIGSNGCGKTVLFKIILGLMKETSGSIYVDDKLRNGFLQDVGTIIERPNFIPYYNAFQNLKIIASYKNKINDTRIKEVISIVGLDPNDPKKLKNYSLGMQQKLAIALAIMEDPNILILDEPLSALDDISVEAVRNIILKEKENGKLILLASHYKEDIEVLCDIVYKIKNGKITKEVKDMKNIHCINR